MVLEHSIDSGTMLLTPNLKEDPYRVVHMNYILILMCYLSTFVELKQSFCFLVDFVRYIQSYYIICFCETKCDDTDIVNVKEKMESIGYDVVFKNRSKLSRHKSGGLLIAVKKNVNLKWRQINSKYESLLTIKIDKDSLGSDKELLCLYSAFAFELW